MELAQRAAGELGLSGFLPNILPLKIFLRLCLRSESLRSGSSSFYLPAISRQTICATDGHLGLWCPGESPQRIRQALGEPLTITLLPFPVHDKAQIQLHHTMHWKYALRRTF